MRKNPNRGFILLLAIVCVSLFVIVALFRQMPADQLSDSTPSLLEAKSPSSLSERTEQKRLSSLPDQPKEALESSVKIKSVKTPVLPPESSSGVSVPTTETPDKTALLLEEEEKTPIDIDLEERKPPPEILERLSISYGEEQEVYTIQAAAYKGPISARRGYDLLEKGLRGRDLHMLRIEKVGSYYTVRLGQSERIAPLREILTKVQNIFPSALISSVFIKDDRIVKIYSPTPQEEFVAAQKEIPQIEERAIEEKEEPTIISEMEVPASRPEIVPAGEQQKEEDEEVVPPDDQPLEVVGKNRTKWLRDQLSMDPITMILKDDQGRNLSYPGSAFYDKAAKELFVVDGRQGRVVVFRSDYLPDVSLGQGRGVNLAVSGAVDKEGNIYVCQQRSDEKPARITRLNAAFFITNEVVFDTIESLEGFNPQRIAIGINGDLYITGAVHGVIVFDRNMQFTHRLIPEEVPAAGRRKGAKPVPVEIKDVAIDSAGRIFLLSEDISRIFVYDYAEKFLYSFGEKGGVSGKLSRPRGIAVDDENGLVFVVDYMRHSLLTYAITGEYITEFGGRGAGPGWFNFPTDIETGPSGHVYVADFFNDRVQVLSIREKKELFQ